MIADFTFTLALRCSIAASNASKGCPTRALRLTSFAPQHEGIL